MKKNSISYLIQQEMTLTPPVVYRLDNGLIFSYLLTEGEVQEKWENLLANMNDELYEISIPRSEYKCELVWI